MLLAFAAALPGIFWNGAPDTAPLLRESGIGHIYVANPAEWKGVAGIAADPVDFSKLTRLKSPAVNYRFEQASASRVPWVDSNGWRFLRQPGGRFYYDAGGALAFAEAFMWHADALVKTDASGLQPLAEIFRELQSRSPADDLLPVADFAFVDDKSSVAGEVMNLLVRGNLLFRVTRASDPKLKLTVQLGTRKYPLEQAKNPGAMAQMIRGDLTDDNRSLRIYGSPVVIGRLESRPGRMRVHLLNYDATRKVNGIRVRVAGEFAHGEGVKLLDYSTADHATEFTVPELKIYAVIDLFR
jgi:hypothetical protein